jgi:hypothetical protein
MRKYTEYIKEIDNKNYEMISESTDNGIFVSFLKCITALGRKDTKADWDSCPDNFIYYYYYPNINTLELKEIFNRFISLRRYIENIDYKENELSLYFGIKKDANLEFGLNYNGVHTPIGNFQLTKGNIKKICQLELKSSYYLKKDIVNLSEKDIIMIGVIKTDVMLYNPGYFQKRINMKINDNIISFGFYGLCKWENGQMSDDEFNILKSNFKKWAVTKKWNDKVLINIKTTPFNVYFNLKLK